MKYFSVLLLTTMLLFSCASCSYIQSSPVDNSQGDGIKNTGGSADVKPEKIDETEIAQQAYDLIDSAESLCKSGMGIISAAWHFGIWDAPECDTDSVVERLSVKIGFDVSFVEKNGGYTADELVNGDGDFEGWEICLITAENCLSAASAYTSVNEALEVARGLIREIPNGYANYQYLKDYYTKVAAYAAYFENVSGSYNDLTEAIAEYESKIQTAKEPLLFDFG